MDSVDDRFNQVMQGLWDSFMAWEYAGLFLLGFFFFGFIAVILLVVISSRKSSRIAQEKRQAQNHKFQLQHYGKDSRAVEELNGLLSPTLYSLMPGDLRYLSSITMGKVGATSFRIMNFTNIDRVQRGADKESKRYFFMVLMVEKTFLVDNWVLFHRAEKENLINSPENMPIPLVQPLEHMPWASVSDPNKLIQSGLDMDQIKQCTKPQDILFLFKDFACFLRWGRLPKLLPSFVEPVVRALSC